MKLTIKNIAGSFLLAASAFVACKEDKVEAPAKNWSFVESFDTLSNALAKGWMVSNNSKPTGTSNWRQASPYPGLDSTIAGGYGYAGKIKITLDSLAGFGANSDFCAQTMNAGCGDFVVAYLNCVRGANTISTWLVSPEIQVKNGDKIIFHTRCAQSPATKADRLQVRMSNKQSSNVGYYANEVGDFTIMLTDINPTYSVTGYPAQWQRYTITVAGLPAPSLRRFAFRYFVEDGGPDGSRSLGIGVDSVAFVSTGAQ
jgi:hypothetical protein